MSKVLTHMNVYLTTLDKTDDEGKPILDADGDAVQMPNLSTKVAYQGTNSKVAEFQRNIVESADPLIDAGVIKLDEVVYLPVVFHRAVEKPKGAAGLSGSNFMGPKGKIQKLETPEAATAESEDIPFE